MTSKKMALNVWNVYGDSVVLILMLFYDLVSSGLGSNDTKKVWLSLL